MDYKQFFLKLFGIILLFIILSRVIAVWTQHPDTSSSTSSTSKIKTTTWYAASTTFLKINATNGSFLIPTTSLDVVSSIMSSIQSSLDSRMSTTRTFPTTTTTTTLLDTTYMTYKMHIPIKFRYCNPILKESCIVINETCCPCGKGYGGRVEAINSKYALQYRSEYLRNCTGFSVVCKMTNSQGCNYAASCINGICELATRW